MVVAVESSALLQMKKKKKLFTPVILNKQHHSEQKGVYLIDERRCVLQPKHNSVLTRAVK